MLEGWVVAWAWWVFTLLKVHRGKLILIDRHSCRALLLAKVDIVKFVFFHLISVLDNFQTFLRQKSKRAGNEADSIIGIVTVSWVITWWRVYPRLFAEWEVSWTRKAQLFLMFSYFRAFTRINSVYSSAAITSVNSITEGILLLRMLQWCWWSHTLIVGIAGKVCSLSTAWLRAHDWVFRRLSPWLCAFFEVLENVRLLVRRVVSNVLLNCFDLLD